MRVCSLLDYFRKFAKNHTLSCEHPAYQTHRATHGFLETLRMPRIILLSFGLTVISYPSNGDPADVRSVIVEYSEYGQFDERIMKTCDVLQAVKKGLNKSGGVSKDTMPRLRVGVDKLRKLAWGSTSANWGGYELGVTVSYIERPEVKQYFSCQVHYGSACKRVEQCSRDIGERVPLWLEMIEKKPLGDSAIDSKTTIE